ncbi:MAG: flotillin-like protein FloA [Myxococcales bacterium]|nr:flotillin-like protein FloA [Myxococcales bacterium]MCB9707983.1 flotillin-like protein FloA [Myxococcales bacterium]
MPFELSGFFIAFVSIVGLVVFLWLIPVPLWIAAWSSGAYVGLMTLIAMRLRRVPPTAIVNPLITAVKAGISVDVSQLESHYLAGGKVNRVVNALISADKAGIDLNFQRAAAIDLAGRDVFEAVQMSVNPRVINTPKITAVAKDGIQLLVTSRITVRSNIQRLVGGATEETVIARVGEGIVSTIGSSENYAVVMENPDRISKNVLGRGLDTGTAFEILSIDIADVDVGANIGAKLSTEKAEADKQIAQAHAESRRALAVAAEQEMKARVEEMRARLVEAEAQVPQAIAEAFSKGHLGVMDYYQMRNVVADTHMRDGIGKATGEGNKEGP